MRLELVVSSVTLHGRYGKFNTGTICIPILWTVLISVFISARAKDQSTPKEINIFPVNLIDSSFEELRQGRIIINENPQWYANCVH